MNTKILYGIVGILIVLWTGLVLAQSESQAINLAKEGNTILDSAKSKEDYLRAAQKYEEALEICQTVKSDKWTGRYYNQLGNIQKRLGQNQKALEYFEKALAINQKTGDVESEGSALNNIGFVYDSLGQNQKALECYEKSLAIWQKTGDVKNEGITLNNIGSVYKALGQYQKALESYEKSLAIRQKIGDVKSEGITLNNIGSVYKALGQYQKALESYEKSLAIRQKIGDVNGEAVTLGKMGPVYGSLGQYQKALESYEKSLAIDKKRGDLRGEGVSLGNIASVYESQGQYAKALESYEKSLAIIQKIGDAKLEGSVLNMVGSVYKSQHQYPKALESYEKSLAISQKIGDVKSEGNGLYYIGGVYNSLRQYAKALEYSEKSLAIRQKIGDANGQGVSLGLVGDVYDSQGEYAKALESYEKAVVIFQKIGYVSNQATCLQNMARVYKCSGQYAKALEYSEKSLAIRQKIGDANGQGVSFREIGDVYGLWGQYSKALEYSEKSLAIFRKIGNVNGQAYSLRQIGFDYQLLGQYDKAMEYAQESLTITRQIGNLSGEADALRDIGRIYYKMGKFDESLANLQTALEISTKIGVQVKGTKNLIGNLYLDRGELNKSEAFIKESGQTASLARFYLLQSDYPKSKTYYEKLLTSAEKTNHEGSLLTAYTGLGKVHEALEDYKKSEEYYEKGMKLAEEIRSGLLPSERKNFFEVNINGFYRSEPSKGLTRVRMKLNQAVQSIDSSEVTRARAFADNISMRSENSVSGISRDIMETEDVLVTKVAALKKELVKTDKEKQAGRYENLQKEVHSAESDLNAFIEMLWDKHKAYAAVKYPRPVTLKESSLRPEEQVVVFDVSTEGVGVKLIKGKKIAETHYTNWKSEDLEKDVKKFRQSFEELKLKEFDYSLGNTLYKRLLSAVLSQVPEGTPIVIIPDGILATLPFEALVTGGKPTWQKVDKEWPDVFKDYPEGLTFLGDEHPISYYQSITALTLVRTTGTKNTPNQKLLVVADPVFDLSDKRAQSATQTKLSEQEKKNNIALMQTIEGGSSGTFKLKRLPQTSILAESLEKTYGSNCLSLTGMKANKSDFLTKIAPTIEQYSGVVFATHGVMSTHVPGLMEPFLALTMAPSGTDGFLKMSDVLSLKMNADVVALTACQSGLGKELSGEGVMSMGRAFQYAGAKSVLMSLWSVAEGSSVKLTESFFEHRKSGKTKLESLKLARDHIRNAGYKHPFFWSAFILVGETN
ncbi:MAG: tetratricopeptide repeat protein [Desulfomonilaceae bacterium]|jgi:tetratricopeptide (TPR) repeat protein